MQVLFCFVVHSASPAALARSDDLVARLMQAHLICFPLKLPGKESQTALLPNAGPETSLSRDYHNRKSKQEQQEITKQKWREAKPCGEALSFDRTWCCVRCALNKPPKQRTRRSLIMRRS